MSIDRIGKGGAPPQTPTLEGKPADRASTAERAERIEKTFSVEKAGGPVGAVEANAIDAASPLARLRAGEIDVDRYVDLKIDAATKNLPPVGPAKLDEIKKMLREQIVTDPGFIDLVRTATGGAPSMPEE